VGSIDVHEHELQAFCQHALTVTKQPAITIPLSSSSSSQMQPEKKSASAEKRS
jgi:hypothetical protein